PVKACTKLKRSRLGLTRSTGAIGSVKLSCKVEGSSRTADTSAGGVVSTGGGGGTGGTGGTGGAGGSGGLSVVPGGPLVGAVVSPVVVVVSPSVSESPLPPS